MQEFFDKWLFDPTIGKIVSAIIGILIIVTIVRLLQRSVSIQVKDKDSRYRIRKIISFLGYILGVIVLVTVFSDKLRGLTVAFGVAGAGIAFALQEVIASVAGWFAISFAHFYKTGDRVQLGGIKGDVIDIGILRTTIMELGEWVQGDLYNGRVVRIANSFVFKEPVFNYSGDFPFLWDEIKIPVKYGSDYQSAKILLERVVEDTVGDYAKQAAIAWVKMVRKFMIEDASVEPSVSLIFNENWVEFTVRYVVDYKYRRSTKTKLSSAILNEIEKSSDRVILGCAAIEISTGSKLDVKIEKK